jgi:glutathione S-transferase
MIARLALLSANIPFTGRRMDIHLAKEQLSDWYLKINPHMTVPSLVDDQQTLTDSHDILNYAATLAGQQWMDSDPSLSQQIKNIVAGQYAIPIEKLTFGKALLSIPPLRLIVPKMLRGIIDKLETELPNSPDPLAVTQKIQINRERLGYFTEGKLADKVEIERSHVRNFLDTLPESSAMLFGDRASSADVVTAVLAGRLKMIGEYGLIKPSSTLDLWFKRIQATVAFKQADIWMRFQPWRIVLKT